MADKRISEYTAKGASIAPLDLMIIAEYVSPGVYVSKTVTRGNVLDARVQTVVSSATVTAVSTNDLVIITAQVGAVVFANPTGVFTEGQSLMLRIKGDGSAITYGAKFRVIGVTLPTLTIINKTIYIASKYNAEDDTHDVLATGTQL